MKKIKPYKSVFYEMSNLTPDDTGLPFIVWVSPKSGKEGHWARVKVEYDGKLYSMSIEDSPEWKMPSRVKIPFTGRQTKQIKSFVKNNKDLLLDYWNSNGTMSMRVVLNKIKKVQD